MTVHILDEISGKGIVSIRDKIIAEEAKGNKIIRSESGTPDLIPPLEWDRTLDTCKDFKYGSNEGHIDLRKAIADTNKLWVYRDIFVTNGAMNALYVLFNSLDIKDRLVIVPEPIWTEIADNVQLAGGRLVSWKFKKYGGSYVYDIDQLKKLIKEHKAESIGAIVVNSPHNPTGAVLSYLDAKVLADICIEHKISLVSDEAYETLTYYNEHVSPIDLIWREGHHNLGYSVHSFSKSYSISGYRLGYIVSKHTNPISERIPKLLRCTINGTNVLSQRLGIECLKNIEYPKKMSLVYEKRKDLMLKSLQNTDRLTPYSPMGGLFVWCEIKDKTKNSWEITENLISKLKIGTAPGLVFTFSGTEEDCYIRFSITIPEEDIIEIGKRLKEW